MGPGPGDGIRIVLSIAICTYRRSAELSETLAALARCAPPADLETEVVIVANDDDRETREVVEAAGVRLVHEPAVGLSHARNTAIAAARGDAILFLDDDVTPDEKLLVAYAEALAAHPESLFFGGPVRAEWTAPKPAWADAAAEVIPGIWALREFGRPSRPFGANEYPFGANMLLRRSAVIPGFRTDLGRSGAENLAGGEEAALFRDLANRGAQGIWVAQAGVGHRIGADRLTLGYVARYFQGNVASNMALGIRVMGHGDSVLRLNARIVATGVQFLWTRLMHRPETWLQTFRKLNVLIGVRAMRNRDDRKEQGGAKCQKAQG